MSETVVTVPPTEAAAAPSLVERVGDTFVAPGRLFARVTPVTPWVDALLVATAIAAVAVAAEPAEHYLGQVENAVDRRGDPVEITSPPEQIVLWGRLMAVLSALAGHPLLGFATAGLLLLLFRVVGGGDASFREYLTVAAHGLLIASAGMIMAVTLRAISGVPEALPTAGFLTGTGGQGWPGALLDGINFFTLWMLGVLAIGVAAIEPRVTRGRAAALLGGGYFGIVVVGTFLFGG